MRKQKQLAPQGALSASVNAPVISNDLVSEIDTIRGEVGLGRAAAESALYRICRIAIDKLYVGQTVKNSYTGEDCAFTDQEDWIRFASDITDVSRATIMLKLAAYRRMDSLGMAPEQAYIVAVNSPGTVRKMAEAVEFDKHGSISGVHVEKARGLDPNDDGYQEALGKITDQSSSEAIDLVKPKAAAVLSEAASLASQREAAKLLDERLGRNTISCTSDGNGKIIVRCTERFVTEQGKCETAGTTTITFEPDGKMPGWALDKLLSKLGATYKVDNNQ